VQKLGEISVPEFKSENDESDLQKVKMLTQMMREHQQSVIRLGKQRRKVVRKLRSRRVPYRVIAHSCGVTDQALFADLRKHPEDE
jgi:hypothetical protein